MVTAQVKRQISVKLLSDAKIERSNGRRSSSQVSVIFKSSLSPARKGFHASHKTKLKIILYSFINLLGNYDSQEYVQPK